MTTINTSVRAVVNQDGAAILDPHRGQICTLNPTGAYIWNALEQGDTIEMIVESLVRDTGGDSETVERDVNEFVGALRERQLVLG